jgi:His-Xaa-Ser repeat protein HxsA
LKKFKTTLALFMASLPLISNKSDANQQEQVVVNLDDITPVQLRPLNSPQENLFAAHRSHSSHRSHRSSSGGGYRAPTPAPAPARAPAPVREPIKLKSPTPEKATPPASTLYGDPESNKPVDPGRAAPVSPTPVPKTKPAAFTKAEKLKLQVMRVQISLLSLGIYSGPINGELSSETKESIKRFQIVKGIEPDGLMSSETLNAMGVRAVQ